MPRRSTVFTLPEGLREELDRRIIAAGFGGYADHAAWLASEGHTLSWSALQRHGRHLRRSVEHDGAKATEAAAAAIARVRQATEFARAIHDVAGDPLDISARTAALCMARLYELTASEDVDAKTLQSISRSLTDNMRAVAGVRVEREAVLREAGRKVAAEARRQGVRPDAIAAIREAVEGGGELSPPPSDVNSAAAASLSKTPSGVSAV